MPCQQRRQVQRGQPAIVHHVAALHHAALVVGQDQVGHLHLREMHRHRVGPVQVRVLRIADGQVAGKTVVELLARERAAGAHQPLLEVLPLQRHVVEARDAGVDQAGLVGLVDRDLGVGQRVVAVFLLAQRRQFFQHGGHGALLV